MTYLPHALILQLAGVAHGAWDNKGLEKLLSPELVTYLPHTPMIVSKRLKYRYKYCNMQVLLMEHGTTNLSCWLLFVNW